MRQNKNWCILKVVRKWEFVEDLNSFCWVEKRIEYLHKAHTKEQCEQAWIELGFEFNPNHPIQCKDMKHDKIWTRFIIQKTSIR